MVLAPFAETKGPRRAEAKPRHDLKKEETRQEIVAPFRMQYAKPRLLSRTPASIKLLHYSRHYLSSSHLGRNALPSHALVDTRETFKYNMDMTSKTLEESAY